MLPKAVHSEERAAEPEDPLREAVALVERVELGRPESDETIVAGFRTDGRLSLYFGDDPCYQFDPQGRLRRAFVEGRLYRSQGSTLAALTRERKSEVTELIRHDLDPAELDHFRRMMLDQIGALRQSLASGHLPVIRQVPAETPILDRLLESLDAIVSAGGELAPAINRMR
jgi:hypothetical protein